MKRILLLLCVLCCIQAPCSASTADSPMRQAMLDAIRAIDDAERTAVSTQSLESLNAAACDQVIRELGLKGKQREQFTALYVTYRDELAKAMHTEVTEAAAPGQAEQREALKTKLDNIAATARIKRDYVDKFAAILTAEQIRQLYNTEGAISTRIKRTAATRRVRETNVTGSGNIVSQSLGAAGDYSVLEVFNDIEVTVSPTATQIIVTADDNVIDWVTLDRQGGSLTLGFRPEARSITDVHITAIVPASASLSRIRANSYGRIVCQMPLKASKVTIEALTGGSVTADADADQLELLANNYGKIQGSLQATRAAVQINTGSIVTASIQCTGDCTISLWNYGQFKGDAQARMLTLDAGGGSTWNGNVVAGDLHLTATNYGKIFGPMHGDTVSLKAAGGGVIRGTFSWKQFTATAIGYGKIDLGGNSTVQHGVVNVNSGGSFSAPDLTVERYEITAASYGKADVRCSGKLSTAITSGGKVSYAGDCTVEAEHPGLVRRR